MALAEKNNNPGNLRDPKTGDFRKFNSPEEGYAGLLNDLNAKMTGTSTTGIGPASTIADFAKVYAPAGDNNDPAQYAANLANHLKVAPNATLGELKPRIGDFADAIAKAESPTPLRNPNENKISQNPSSIANTTPIDTSAIVPEKKEGGFVNSVIGAITDPVAELGFGLGNKLRGLVGKEKMSSFVNPLTGQDVNALGYRDGKELSGAETLKQGAGDVAQIASLAIPEAKLIGGATKLAKIGNASLNAGIGLGTYGAGAEASRGGTTNEIVNEGIKSGLLGAATGGTLSSIGNAISSLPQRFIEGAFKDLTPETAQYALKKPLGTIGGMLKESTKTLDLIGNQVDKLLKKADNVGKFVSGTEVYQRAIKGNPEVRGSGLADSGYSQEQLAKITKNLVKNQGSLVDDLFTGDISLIDANRLKTALGKTIKWSSLDNPGVAQNKQAGAQVYHALSDIIKQKAPETKPLFEQFEKEIPLQSSLEKMKEKGGILGGTVTMKELLAGGTIAMTGGIPGLLGVAGYHALSSPIGSATIGKIIDKSSNAVGKTAKTTAGLLNRTYQSSKEKK